MKWPKAGLGLLLFPVLAGSAAPPADGIRPRLNEIWEQISAAQQAPQTATDAWRMKMQQEILDVASVEADWGNMESRRLLRLDTDCVVQSWGENKEAKNAFLRALLGSGNGVLREYAAAQMRLAELSKTPLMLRFTAIDGREVDLDRLRGKVVLLEYWGVHCTGCVALIPALKELYAQYHARGFEIVGLAGGRDAQKVRHFVEQHAVLWPQRVDPKAHEAEFGRYGFVYVSNLLLLDKNGKLVMSAAEPGKEELERAIRAQL